MVVSSYNIEFTMYIIDPINYEVLRISVFLRDHRPLTPGSFRPAILPLKNSFSTYDKLIVLIHGSYSKDFKNHDKSDLLDAVYFNFSENKLLGEVPSDISTILEKMH